MPHLCIFGAQTDYIYIFITKCFRMAISKYPLIRYKVLDKCFRATYKKYFIEDLVLECNKVLYEITGDVESIKLRQIREDIAFMRSPEGWEIELAELFIGKKRIYRYENPSFSIMNLPLNQKVIEEFNLAKETLSQFEGLPQFDWLQETLAEMNIKTRAETNPVISFDSNPYLKGIGNLTYLYHAINNKQVLDIVYQDFNAPKNYKIKLHPYFLKQYNNRWFLFGLNQENNVATWNLAIDRILEISTLNEIYIENYEFDWQEYFEDIIGVTKPQNKESELVILYFLGITGKYIENKPIHGSQKTKWINDQTLEIRLNLIVNYELERLILSYGEQVKVVSPLSLIDRISYRISNAYNQY